MLLCFSFSDLPELPVSYITIVVLALALLGFLAGLFKGFGSELLGLIKMAGVIFGSAFATTYLLPIAQEKVPFLANLEGDIQKAIIYALSFIVIWLVLAIIVGLIKRMFLRPVPGGASRFFGGILGLVKFAFVGLVLVYIVSLIANEIDEVAYFIDNAKIEPIGTFIVENNPIQKVVELVQNLIK